MAPLISGASVSAIYNNAAAPVIYFIFGGGADLLSAADYAILGRGRPIVLAFRGTCSHRERASSTSWPIDINSLVRRRSSRPDVRAACTGRQDENLKLQGLDWTFRRLRWQELADASNCLICKSASQTIDAFKTSAGCASSQVQWTGSTLGQSDAGQFSGERSDGHKHHDKSVVRVARRRTTARYPGDHYRHL